MSGTGLSIADSGHALTITQDLSSKQDTLTVNNNVGGIPVLDFNTNEVRKIDTAGDAIVTVSQANSGSTIRLTCDGMTRAEVTAAIAAVAITNAAGTSVNLVYNGAIRTLSFSGAIAYAFSSSFNTLEVSVPCCTQTQSDARCVQTGTEISVTSGNIVLKMLATGFRNEIRYQNGPLRIRRLSRAGDIKNHCQFADSQNGATIFYNGTTNSSDNRIKDNEQAPQEAM